MSRLGMRGDTIVEVLIALAVTSSLIIAGYNTANRSLKGGQQSQERGEALKLVESQAEALHIMHVAGRYPIEFFKDTLLSVLAYSNSLVRHAYCNTPILIAG